jgi:site-specific DNA recombinase
VSRKTFRCAIYTRKSSDEGLEQSFNSLDAQREAGEAYVKSQAHEGWKASATLYDDGGYSGGTMERPALQRLLADVDAGLIDVVVVYKIDRLTRSLADFARIVERFDAHEVSFVSVTQAFNTTSSMGRLTLNVLLSFAQFEREVTGERIRDKIAASKAKGMWMGGNPPLGYDLPASETRILQVNADEAATVRHIFARYLELGSVHALQRELTGQGIVSKQRVTASGRTVGGLPFSRGALFHMLRSPIYLGRIPHKDVTHEGGHLAIVPQDLFDRVQGRLDSQARRHRAAGEQRAVKAPLTGKLFDAFGEPMSPTFSRGKSGRLYRYYVSASLQQGGKQQDDDTIRRLPAVQFEKLIGELAARWMPSTRTPLELPLSVRLRDRELLIDMPHDLASDIAHRLGDGERILHTSRQACRVAVPLLLPLRGGKKIITAGARASKPDRALIAALRKAHRMVALRRGLPVIATAPASRYDREVLRLAFLAPDLQRDILAGRQPPTLSLETLRQVEIPLCWRRQRRVLGWREQG